MSFRRALLILLPLLIAPVTLGYAAPADDLARSFAQPPLSARPWVYWFWLNGNITREGITADLEAMKRVGIGGVLIMEVDQGAPVGPVDFNSPKWRELFKHVVSEADRLGLEVNMNDDAGWNGSGGPWVTPDKAMQKVTWSETGVEGGKRFEGVLPKPATVRDFYRDVSVLAFPTAGDYRIEDIQGKAGFTRRDEGPVASYPTVPPAQCVARSGIVDLTAKMTPEGKLTWDAPAGNWTVLRLGHTCTGAVNAPAPLTGQGLECDKLSKEGSEANFDPFIGKLAAENGALTGKSFIATHVDSWENGSQNWTPKMRAEFTRLRGYDPLPYLPVITGRVVDSLEVSERFLYDLRETISDLLLENYAGHIRELANKHGMRLTIEAYGDTTVDNLAYAGRADEPMGEFWSWPGFGAGGTLSSMSSSAHVYGKPICGAEAFTAGDGEKWQYHPGNIKAMGDWAFCLGINRFVFHRYALQPWLNYKPGMCMGPWGLHWERTQTWWEQSKPWNEYLARCQYLLRSGLPVVDVLCLAPEGAPRDASPPTPLLRAGYKGDVCSTEALFTRLSVKNGRLVCPDGMSYRALALPGSPTMTPKLLRRLGEFARAGATIIGPPPQKAPGLTDYPKCDTEVRDGAKTLWATGKIITGKSPEQALAAQGVAPDFTADRALDFIHRSIGDTEAYFVANRLTHATNAMCSFRVTGRQPELWNPETGVTTAVPTFEEVNGVTRIPLRFEVAGSTFVIFRANGAKNDPVARVVRSGKVVWPAPPPKLTKVTIRHAIWGPSDEDGRSRDVTQQIQDMVGDGKSSFVVADLASQGDPAPNVVKPLVVEYTVAGQARTAKGNDPDRIKLCEPGETAQVVIRHAVYGFPVDKKRTIEVTKQVQALVDKVGPSFVVSELVATCGDPAFKVVKTLQVEYAVNGRVMTVSAQDPDTINFELPDDGAPPVRLEREADGRLVADASEPGAYALQMKSGRTLKFNAPPAKSAAVGGQWEVRFPTNAGAPERITLDALSSWSANRDPGVKYFSGTGTYHTALDMPAALIAADRRIMLDLGRVEIMAEVILNGKNLGILWKTPYEVDVTNAVKPGANDLEIRVTNLWINRMIGDEQLPEDSKRYGNGTLKEWPQWVLDGKPSPTGRFTFTDWRLWRKGDPLQDSGLLGPVVLRSTARVVVK